MRKLVCFLLVLTSCASTPPFAFKNAKDVPTYWGKTPVKVMSPVIDVEHAIYRWNYALGFQLFQKVSLCNPKEDSCVFVVKELIEEPVDRAAETVYHYDDLTGVISIAFITVDTELDEKYYDRMLVHELGHSVGLVHVDDPTSVMFESVDENPGEIGQDLVDYLRTMYD